VTAEGALVHEPTLLAQARAASTRVRHALSRPWIVWAIFLAIVGWDIWVHLPSMNQKLLELHSFRQTQTAWTALIFHQQGIDLFHPKIPVFGPPWEVPFEFPLFQALGALVMDAGVPTDLAMRSTGFFTFLVALFILWRLVARLAGEAAGLVSVIAFAVCALALLWARTSMIEYFVVAASLAMIYGALRWHESNYWGWWVVALGAGVVAMLVKPTTAVMYLPAVLALGWSGYRAGPRRPLTKPLLYAGALLALLVVPLLFGGIWTAYADKVKGAQQFTADQTSAALTTWNFGTMAQRLSPTPWEYIGGRLQELVLGGATVIWVPLGFIASLWLKRRLFTIAWLAGAFIGPLVFTNLYFIHDYYLIALSPMAAATVGIGLVWTFKKWKWLLPPILGVVLIVAWATTLQRAEHYWGIEFWETKGGEQHGEAAAYIDARSNPGDYVAIVARGWNPATLYYADRWGLMIEGTEEYGLDQGLGPLLPQLRAWGFTRLFDCPSNTPCIAAWDITADPPRQVP
jgi:4-amino-4-deoxy-L-arabinose transferase-like glycosyltransferase